MQITKGNPEGIDVFTVQGQLDGTTSPQLETELLGPIQARASQFILDLDQVALISSAALRVLLSAAKRMKKHGGRILLCALRPEVKQVFDISDLTAFFAIHPDLAAALAAAKSAPVAAAPAIPAVLAAPVIAAPSPVAPVPSTPAPTPKPAAVPETIEIKPALPPPSQPVAPAAPPSPAATTPARPVSVTPSSPPAAPAATTTPAAPVSIPTPTPKPATIAPPAIPPPAAPAVPLTPPVPAQPLRRTSPAVLAKAVETRGSTSPTPAATTPASVASPATPAPSLERPAPRPMPADKPAAPSSVAEPPPISRPVGPRRITPVVVGAACVLLGLIGLATYLLVPKKSAPVEVVETTPAPPTAPPDVASPASTGPVEPPPSTPAPTPRTPPPVVVVSTPRTSPPVVATPPSATPAATQDNVTSASGAVNFNQANPENEATRQAVLRRIDAMPLTQENKERLYTALDRSRGLGKLVTINFASGHTDLAPGDVEKLRTTLRQPELQRFTSDPSVIIVVLGYADTHGNERTNKDVSERRARKVVDALQGPCGVSNVIHNLGMGGQAIAGESREKNRIVEVWAVLP